MADDKNLWRAKTALRAIAALDDSNDTTGVVAVAVAKETLRIIGNHPE